MQEPWPASQHTWCSSPSTCARREDVLLLDDARDVQRTGSLPRGQRAGIVRSAALLSPHHATATQTIQYLCSSPEDAKCYCNHCNNCTPRKVTALQPSHTLVATSTGPMGACRLLMCQSPLAYCPHPARPSSNKHRVCEHINKPARPLAPSDHTCNATHTTHDCFKH